MSSSVVEVRGVRKVFGRRGQVLEALRMVDMSVEPAEFVALVGPSGCGKSTLLNIIGGLIPASRGELFVAGHRVDGPLSEVGMMFQDPVLLEWRTSRDNVLLPIEIRGGRRAVRNFHRHADELLELVGLTGFEEAYPGELSGGMQQRVAICRMLIADPGVLLLDEPFGALDELTREYMNVELARVVSSAAKAAIFVTHNIQEAVFLSDRVFVITPRPGRVVGVVDVDLPRPRSLDLVTTEPFQRLARQVRRFLDLGAEDERASVPSPGVV